MVHVSPADPRALWPGDRRVQVALRHPGRRAEDLPLRSGARHYRLRCPVCGSSFEDDGVRLRCSEVHEPALLLADYRERAFCPDPSTEGIFRYRNWLPAARALPDAGTSAIYYSPALNRTAGLTNVWVSFNGYWPERGATLETTTFKELEAWAVLARGDTYRAPQIAAAL